MKKLSLVVALLCSMNVYADLVCPRPESLSAQHLTFYDWSTVERSSANKRKEGPQFIAQGYFEANDKVWSITLGLFDENRPRHQAKQLLLQAKEPTVIVDEDDGSESCNYLDDSPNWVGKMLIVDLADDFKPCPSLQTIKDKPLVDAVLSCDSNNQPCDSYTLSAELYDRGNHWALLSFSYDDPNTAIAETEALKSKLYGPFIEDFLGACEYFRGVTKSGNRGLYAIPMDDNLSQASSAQLKAQLQNQSTILKPQKIVKLLNK